MNEQIPEWLKQEAERKYPELFQQCNGGHHEMYGICDVNFYERQAYIAGALSRSGGVWVNLKGNNRRLPEPGRVIVKKWEGKICLFHHTGSDMSKINLSDQYDLWFDETAADKGDAIDGWIKLNGVAGEIEDCNCWLYKNDGEIIFSPKGQYVKIGKYDFYLPIKKPQPPQSKQTKK